MWAVSKAFAHSFPPGAYGAPPRFKLECVPMVTPKEKGGPEPWGSTLDGIAVCNCPHGGEAMHK